MISLSGISQIYRLKKLKGITHNNYSCEGLDKIFYMDSFTYVIHPDYCHFISINREEIEAFRQGAVSLAKSINDLYLSDK